MELLQKDLFHTLNICINFKNLQRNIMDELKSEIAELKEKIDLLTIAVEKLTGTTERMDTHIDFVEQTYSTLRTPLDFVRRQFTKTVEALPPPPHQE